MDTETKQQPQPSQTAPDISSSGSGKGHLPENATHPEETNPTQSTNEQPTEEVIDTQQGPAELLRRKLSPLWLSEVNYGEKNDGTNTKHKSSRRRISSY
jgi:hypothetical protein